MLLQFELCGQDTAASGFAFRLDQALNFTKLVLKDVRIVCGNDLLHETWASSVHGVGASNRVVTAPLYLTLDALTDSNVAHYLPTTFPANDERNAVVSNHRIDISHALSNTGTLEEAGKRRSFDYTLVEGDTHWERGKVLTFGLERRSLEHAGLYGPPTALSSTTWDRACRLVVTLEATGSQQSEVVVPSTAVPLFSGDGGAGANPTIAAANYDAPTELGGADVHTTAFLFASTAGDSKNITAHHMGPFTCAAGRELMVFNVYQGTTVLTHRTGIRSIPNVDTYLRGLSPHGTTGYGSIRYANASGATYSDHSNRYYVIAVTPLSGGD
jgi:hypothetical protein